MSSKSSQLRHRYSRGNNSRVDRNKYAHIKVVIFGFVMFGKVLGSINEQFGGDFQSMELYDLSHM